MLHPGSDMPQQLTLYTRGGCSLCAVMEDQLAQLAHDLAFTMIRLDLLDHPQFESRYGEWVPVLMAGAMELCHYELDEAKLKAWLEGRSLG